MKKIVMTLVLFLTVSIIRAEEYRYDVKSSTAIKKIVILEMSIDEIKNQRQTTINLLIALENYYQAKKEEYQKKLDEYEKTIRESIIEEWEETK